MMRLWRWLRRPRLPYRATAAEVLAALDAWALARQRGGVVPGSDPEVSRVWSVLTALRGPDDDCPEVKMLGAARVRALALPHLSIEYGVTNFDGCAPTARGARSDHYAEHIERAVYALRKMNLLKEDA